MVSQDSFLLFSFDTFTELCFQFCFEFHPISGIFRGWEKSLGSLRRVFYVERVGCVGSRKLRGDVEQKMESNICIDGGSV